MVKEGKTNKVIESENQSKKRTGFLLTRSDITSFVALFISVGVLAVSLFETKIMREQQKIMQQQQEAAVYPHLEFTKVILNKNGDLTLRIQVTNFGTGLAIITNQESFLNEKVLNTASFNSIVDEYKIVLKLSNNLTNNVLPPGKSEDIFNFSTLDDASPELLNTLYNNFNVGLCYRSIYNNYWTASTKEQGFPKALYKNDCSKKNEFD